MTSYDHDLIACPVCAHSFEQMVLASTNTFGGSMDLDTRPPEMERSTMGSWTRVCPECDARWCDWTSDFADVLLADPAFALEVIESEEYKAELARDDCPDLASDLRAAALLAERTGELVEAGWCMLYAAWQCDDAEASDEAGLARVRAANLFTRARDAGVPLAEDPGAGEAILADAYRRAGRHEQAIAECDRGIEADAVDVIRVVLDCERALARRGDTACYTLEDAMNGAGETDAHA